MAALGYLPKLKRGGLELAFSAHFLHGFFIQILLSSYVVSFFTFENIKQTVFISSHLDN